MTGRRDDDQTDVPLPQRATTSESATEFPAPPSGVVQDSPGSPEVDLEGGRLLDDQGNYRRENDENDVVDGQAEGGPT
ncbi:hypothetical protein [Deinococcus sp. YIM 77859]|uniref:hypothetical protein n=1 Tax=Deinococcus sp. YIM 77859 TaxID=1540221 RepID=UPI000556CFA1|nr:hypothetical protein [Deinococcus sp. YIM 77859]